MAAFALLVRAQSMGRSVTPTELADLAGSREDGDNALDSGFTLILLPFMEPTKRE